MKRDKKKGKREQQKKRQKTEKSKITMRRDIRKRTFRQWLDADSYPNSASSWPMLPTLPNIPPQIDKHRDGEKRNFFIIVVRVVDYLSNRHRQPHRRCFFFSSLSSQEPVLLTTPSAVRNTYNNYYFYCEHWQYARDKRMPRSYLTACSDLGYGAVHWSFMFGVVYCLLCRWQGSGHTSHRFADSEGVLLYWFYHSHNQVLLGC